MNIIFGFNTLQEQMKKTGHNWCWSYLGIEMEISSPVERALPNYRPSNFVKMFCLGDLIEAKTTWIGGKDRNNNWNH